MQGFTFQSLAAGGPNCRFLKMKLKMEEWLSLHEEARSGLDRPPPTPSPCPLLVLCQPIVIIITIIPIVLLEVGLSLQATF